MCLESHKVTRHQSFLYHTLIIVYSNSVTPLCFWFSPQVVNIVKSHIGQEHNEEAWTLLAMLSGYITIKNVTFAVDYFEQHCQNPEEVRSLKTCLIHCNVAVKILGDNHHHQQQPPYKLWRESRLMESCVSIMASHWWGYKNQ